MIPAKIARVKAFLDTFEQIHKEQDEYPNDQQGDENPEAAIPAWVHRANLRGDLMDLGIAELRHALIHLLGCQLEFAEPLADDFGFQRGLYRLKIRGSGRACAGGRVDEIARREHGPALRRQGHRQRRDDYERLNETNS